MSMSSSEMAWLTAALWITAPPGIVTAVEPHPPEQFVQALEISCGADRLLVRGTGHRRPHGTAEVLFNGLPPTGEAMGALRADLSEQVGSVYRLSAQCSGGGNGILLNISVASRSGGAISYRVGRAAFSEGRLVDYSGLEAANDDVFWYG